MFNTPSSDFEKLRALISRIEGSPQVQRGSLPFERPQLQHHLGGWPRPGISELCGQPGSGRLSLVLPTLARLTRQGQAVAVVDPLGQIHPPGWTGVELSRLLVVQPAPDQSGWTCEQLARSGAFELVLLLSAARLGRSGARLARAAEAGNCAVILLSEHSERSLPAALRLQVQGFRPEGQRIVVGRRRGGRAGFELTLPVR